MSESARIHHYPRCYGCGDANESGLQLIADWNGEQCIITHLPPAAAEGGPGIVHGGYVGALADEAMALLASHVTGYPAMTRRVELDFRAPTLTQTALTLTAWVEEERSRAIIVRMEGRQGDPERLCFEAKGVFMKVSASTWADPISAGNRGTGKLGLDSGDPSNLFRWQVQGFKTMYNPATLVRELQVAVRITDVNPPEWTLTASSAEFDAAEGIAPAHDAILECSFDAWNRLAHDRALQLADLTQAGQATVTGDSSAVEALFVLFHRNQPGG